MKTFRWLKPVFKEFFSGGYQAFFVGPTGLESQMSDLKTWGWSLSQRLSALGNVWLSKDSYWTQPDVPGLQGSL